MGAVDNMGCWCGACCKWAAGFPGVLRVGSDHGPMAGWPCKRCGGPLVTSHEVHFMGLPKVGVWITDQICDGHDEVTLVEAYELANERAAARATSMVDAGELLGDALREVGEAELASKWEALRSNVFEVSIDLIVGGVVPV